MAWLIQKIESFFNNTNFCMKTSKYFYVLLLMVLVLPFAACNDTDDGSYVEPITVYEKIYGNWKVSSVKQVDEIAKANNESPSEMTLTDQFDFSSFTISLNVDANNQPTTYTIGGNSPRFFPTEGYWALDYEFHNTTGAANVIQLYSDASRSSMTAQLSVVGIPGSSREMEIKFSRNTKGTPFVSYVYKLTPANE